MKSISLNKDIITIRFDYTPGLVSAIKNEVPGRRWNKDERMWYVEAAPDTAQTVIDFAKRHGFTLDPKVSALLSTLPSYKKKHRDELYGFQKAGVDFLHTSGGRALLSDDCGLGKSPQSLIWMYEIGFKRALIISPATVSFKWKNEVARWIPEKSAEVTVTSQEPLPKTDIVIMSHAIFLNRIQELKDKFDLFVIDECHRGFSNSRTKSWKAAKLMQVEKIALLSGTPFLNRPKELWSLLNLIRPHKWTSFFYFGNKYCAGHKNYFGWDFNGVSNIEELKMEIAPYFLRRTKKEVLSELPDLQRIYMPVLMNKDATYEYNKVLQRKMDSHANKLAALGALRHQVGLGKIEAALEVIQSILENESKKVVVYCHHLDVLNHLDVALRKDYNIRIIQGDTAQIERANHVQDFQTNPDVRIMLITSAGGEGIDLYAASDIVFVERAWNPGKEEQAEGRCHRIGQKNNVTAHYIIALNTIDERVDKLIRKKREVVGSIIGMDKNDETTITKELIDYLEEVR